MYKLHRIREKIQTQFLPFIPPKLHDRFLVGVQAFSLKRFTSINANGRSTARKRCTGESRTYRLTHDERFCELLPELVANFVNHSIGEIRMSLDFSKIGPLQIACLAVTTGKGRALPIWIKPYTIKPKKGTMIPSLIKALDKFFTKLENLDRINICMDRWFISPRLLRFIDCKGARFIVRMKSGLKISVPWEDYPIPILQIATVDTECEYAEMKLRLIQSDWNEKMKEDEPWFLLTNDTELSRRQVINRYAKRFEIEEFFKDVQWIQGYEWNQIETRVVLEVIFWFVILGWWLLREVFWCEILKSRSRNLNPKKKLSFFRVAWEAFDREVSAYGFTLVDT